MLDEADFGAVTMREVRFDGCELRAHRMGGARSSPASTSAVRSSSPRATSPGCAARSSIPVQLAGLAPLLAHAAGIVVKDG